MLFNRACRSIVCCRSGSQCAQSRAPCADQFGCMHIGSVLKFRRALWSLAAALFINVFWATITKRVSKIQRQDKTARNIFPSARVKNGSLSSDDASDVGAVQASTRIRMVPPPGSPQGLATPATGSQSVPIAQEPVSQFFNQTTQAFQDSRQRAFGIQVRTVRQSRPRALQFNQHVFKLSRRRPEFLGLHLSGLAG